MTANAEPLRKKPYRLELADDLKGWKPCRIRVRSVYDTVAHDQGGPLQEEFDVFDAPDSPMPLIEKGYLQVTGKKRLARPNELQFHVELSAGFPEEELSRLEAPVRLQVARLDLASTGAAGAMGAALGAAGGGMLGGAVGSAAAAQSAHILAGVCQVEIEKPQFFLTIEKFRWAPSQKQALTDILDLDEIARLHREGGTIQVPVACRAEQEYRGESLRFSDDAKPIAIRGVRATLDWMGKSIPGYYDDQSDPEQARLLFDIKPVAKTPAPSSAPA